MLRVAILGASGYTGSELLRLLNLHKYVAVTSITSERFSGQRVSDLFLNIRDDSMRFEPLNLETIMGKAELFFLCLPHKTSQDIVAKLNRKGKRVIDLSADYRLKDAGVYKEWYRVTHRFPRLLKKAVYGLPEIYRDEIKDAGIVANPGCYPTGAILGLAPVIDKDFIDTSSIIIDSKSGVSGAGRNPDLPFMFSEANESVKAYAVTTHRHTPEIEQELSNISGREIRVVFTPHLIPMDRGIFTTIYVRLKKKVSLDSIRNLYREYYKDEAFVRVLGEGKVPTTKWVKGSNYCDIAIFLETRGEKQTLIVVNAIDNLLKGASGQAVQNMNIMFGFKETEGLINNPTFP
ncbi:MAG: N-acetyl-gamma-glutamyl-phosphate reductase [Thermodesulfovibrionia bacterium]